MRRIQLPASLNNVLFCPLSRAGSCRRIALLSLSLISLLVSVPATQAQSQTDGSIYSRFGLGQREAYNSPKSQAMGGGGFALRSIDFSNHANPASLSDQIFARFAGGFTLQGLTETAENADVSRLRSGYLNALQISFPLITNRLGFGFSFEPYTRVNYRVDTAGSLVVDPDEGTSESYLTSFRGNGGIQRISGGLGLAVGSRLHVGIRTDFLFGHVEETQQTDFQNIQLRDGNVTSSTRLRGTTGTLGLRYVIRNVTGNQDALSIGAVYTLPVALSGKRIHTMGEGETTDTLGTPVKGSVDLPMAFGFGVAYQPNSRWTLIADVLYEEWSAFKSELDFPGYSVGSSAGFSDRVRLSAGVEFYPGARSSFSTFFQRLALRMGAYSDKSYVSPDADREIKSFGITGGLSLPSLIGGTSLDINVDVGRRGTTDFGLIRDKFVRLGISFNFGERWFDRAKLR